MRTCSERGGTSLFANVFNLLARADPTIEQAPHCLLLASISHLHFRERNVNEYLLSW
jgi:hypothetical protein